MLTKNVFYKNKVYDWDHAKFFYKYLNLIMLEEWNPFKYSYKKRYLQKLLNCVSSVLMQVLESGALVIYQKYPLNKLITNYTLTVIE